MFLSLELQLEFNYHFCVPFKGQKNDEDWHYAVRNGEVAISVLQLRKTIIILLIYLSCSQAAIKMMRLFLIIHWAAFLLLLRYIYSSESVLFYIRGS